jgi:hypothetical protein
MTCDCSISLNGIFAAERNLSQVSRRIAFGSFPDPADVVQVAEARNSVEANLKVISTQQELDRENLDLFA